MRPRIRPFDDRNAEAVVDLSLRAWTPVFASLEQALGSGIFKRQHPDWREDQRRLELHGDLYSLPGGLFDPKPDTVEEPLEDADASAITVEPEGGSPQPTPDPMFAPEL